jgi:hypothetical protein
VSVRVEVVSPIDCEDDAVFRPCYRRGFSLGGRLGRPARFYALYMVSGGLYYSVLVVLGDDYIWHDMMELVWSLFPCWSLESKSDSWRGCTRVLGFVRSGLWIVPLPCWAMVWIVL